jgi:hypothetical protein
VVQAVNAASSVPAGWSGFFGSPPAGHCGPVAAPEELAADEPVAPVVPVVPETLGALEPAAVVDGATVEAAVVEAAVDPAELSDGAPWVVIRPVVPASAEDALGVVMAAA